jgi:hypothetical protein
MLTSYSDVKDQVLTEIREYDLTNDTYPEDRLNEMADSAVPVYTNEIISEWVDLPFDSRDRWQDFGADSNATITHLMALDLLVYYQELFSQTYFELTKDLEEQDAE